MEEKKKVKYLIEPKSFLAKASAILMVLAMVMQLIGSWPMFKDKTYLYTAVLLPLAGTLLFLLFVLLAGKKAYWTISVPVLLGAAFFIIRAIHFTGLLTIVLGIVLGAVIAVLQIGVAFGGIRGRWMMPALYVLAVVFEVMLVVRPAYAEFTAFDWLLEVAAICALLSMMLCSFAVRKWKPEQEPDLPKMRGPQNVVPGSMKREQEERSETEQKTDETKEAVDTDGK